MEPHLVGWLDKTFAHLVVVVAKLTVAHHMAGELATVSNSRYSGTHISSNGKGHP